MANAYRQAENCGFYPYAKVSALAGQALYKGYL